MSGNSLIIKRPKNSLPEMDFNIMSYHWLPNIGKILQGDIVSKVGKGIGSIYFLNPECSCNSATKVNDICAYGGEYRVCCMVLNLIFKLCNLFYVVNNKNTHKKSWKNSNMWLKRYHTVSIWTIFSPFFHRFNQKPSLQYCCKVMKF